MSWAPARSVVRVLGPQGATAGTAFFVTDRDGPLLATCSHVLSDAGLGPGDLVELNAQPPDAPPAGIALQAYVEPEPWRPGDAEDIAMLRLAGDLPTGCAALPLTVQLGSQRTHRSWGYPRAKPLEGLAAHVTNLAPATEGGAPAVQARSEEVSHGFSGAPVWDDEADAAIGMVMSIVGTHVDAGGRQQTTFFLRPTEELWKACPALQGSPENPYRGLAVFEDHHADLYFGRDAAIATLLTRLGDHDLVAVVGPSGSGKSSLVRAGLQKGLGATQAVGLADKQRVVFRPGSTPTLDLALAVTDHAGDRALGVDDLVALSAVALAEELRALLSPGAILIVDQFERLFTDCPDDAGRRQFADALLALADQHIKILLTLRADFYGEVLKLPDLGAAVERGQVTVFPMTHDELTDAVVEPARARLRALEPGLAQELIADIEGHPGDLPLLQLALTELWKRDASFGVLRSSTYRDLGSHTAHGEPLRVRGVIAHIAEEHWASLSAEEGAAARKVLLSLVAPGPVGAAQLGTTRASRRALQLEWDEDMKRVAGKFVDARLLTSGRDAASNEPTVEVAHEALIWACTISNLTIPWGESCSASPWCSRFQDTPMEIALKTSPIMYLNEN